ncbi:hypothetical protein SAMN05421754_10826 [Nitrosomonas sp. Nm58]|nr:hypothetical protein SAMN05421754_10826 [Nitrosomonas sp. Nm58]
MIILMMFVQSIHSKITYGDAVISLDNCAIYEYDLFLLLYSMR